jgi:hypothetical protein
VSLRDNRLVLRVYLDQAKWIDFAKCRVGRGDGQRFRDAFDISTEAVRLGHASFVLSPAHYFETHRRADWSSRLNLATTMARLSRFHGIAPPHVAVPAEIDAALADDGRGLTVNVFGVGTGHVFGGDIPLDFMKLPEGIPVAPGVRSQLAAVFSTLMEFAILSNPPMFANTERIMLERRTEDPGRRQEFAEQHCRAVPVGKSHLRDVPGPLPLGDNDVAVRDGNRERVHVVGIGETSAS